MMRSTHARKILTLSLIANCACLIYLLFNHSYTTRIKSYYSSGYVNSDGRPIHVLSSQSSKSHIVPMVHNLFEQNYRLNLFDEFQFVSNKRIPSTDLLSAIDRYRRYFSTLTNISTDHHIVTSQISHNQLLLDCSSIDFNQITSYPTFEENESYQLTINFTGSFLHATSLTGFIRGLSTFIQLIGYDTHNKQFFLPHIQIDDTARFKWRGLMIDVCRHWIPMNVIQRTIDAMELSKLNVLHLHLSDDQGFRLESHRYPRLHDRTHFFTQQQMKQLIEYARQRRIRVVPEFDIPGHTTSWFIGYPDLATEAGPYQVETQWGVMKPTMDPTKNSTYEFLDEFFKEMTSLFPDPFFHIGGDEVEGSQWMSSIQVQQFIQNNQLRTKNGLQAYFIKQVYYLLKKYNKALVGWEEIVEETEERLLLDKDAVIHSWKSRKSFLEAVNKGYRALLSNGFYLDHISSSSFHYKNDLVGEEEMWLFNKEQQDRILGGEACMWTEYVSANTFDTRIWPRVLAVAERLWSPASVTDERSFYERHFAMSHLLHRLRIGLTHSYVSFRRRIETLIGFETKKKSFLHPFLILAKACEATGYPQRSQAGIYSSLVPLTTFNDALQCESESIWKLQYLPIKNQTFFETFRSWSLNHYRLRHLFQDDDMEPYKKAWGQDIEQLSKNLAEVGRIGLTILNYAATRQLFPETNNSMNSWSLLQWVVHHRMILNQLETQVQEIRLAAVRPVLRLLNSIERIT